MNTLRYTNLILTVLTLLLGVQLYTQWATGPVITPAAQAQGIPDSGAQRAQVIDQLKLLNKNVTDISRLLESGKLRVTVTEQGDQR